jgi:hypothetical protein
LAEISTSWLTSFGSDSNSAVASAPSAPMGE